MSVKITVDSIAYDNYYAMLDQCESFESLDEAVDSYATNTYDTAIEKNLDAEQAVEKYLTLVENYLTLVDKYLYQ